MRRPALERVLSRPSTLSVLKQLLLSSSCLVSNRYGCRHVVGGKRRYSATVATAPNKEEQVEEEIIDKSPLLFRPVFPPVLIDSPLPPVQPAVHRIRTNLEYHIQLEPSKTESHVAAAAHAIERLLGQPSLCHDIELWIQLLELRQRLEGRKGVEHVWKAIKSEGIDLPTSGEQADRLWSPILSWAFRTELGLKDIYQYALSLRAKTGNMYAPLYERVVGHYLRGNPQLAYVWHKRMHDDAYNSRPNVLNRLCKIAIGSVESLGVFKRLYLDSKERNIHDTLIRAMCSAGQFDSAYKWRKFLIRMNDLPVDPLASQALMDHLAALDNTASPTTAVKKAARAVQALPDIIETTATTRPTMSRDMIYKFLGYTHNIVPKTPNDELCARIFATKAFSLQTVIQGLGILGVENIGPLAMREMASRAFGAGGPENLLREIALLKKAGISIGDSMFSRLIEKFAAQGKRDLVQDMLSSDQHPDVYEDRSVLRELLTAFIRAEDWRQFHRVLAVLTAFHPNPPHEAWNILLRMYIKQDKSVKIIEVLEEMRMNSIIVSAASLSILGAHRLPPRHPGRRPTTDPQGRDDLRLVANIYLSTLLSGRPVPTWRWREVIRRFGMTGRFEELQRLLLWLARFYSASKFRPMPLESRGDSSTPLLIGVPKHIPASDPTHPLRQLFSPSLQRAVLAWSIQAAFHPTRRKLNHISHFIDGDSITECDEWARGLVLLNQLRKHGVLVQTSTVREALRQRLWTIFGPFGTNHHANVIDPEVELPSLRHMVRHAEGLWGNKLFQLDHSLLQGGFESDLRYELFGLPKARWKRPATLAGSRRAWRFVLRPWHRPGPYPPAQSEHDFLGLLLNPEQSSDLEQSSDFEQSSEFEQLSDLEQPLQSASPFLT